MMKSRKKVIRLKSDICAKCGNKISFIPTQMNIHLMHCDNDTKKK